MYTQNILWKIRKIIPGFLFLSFSLRLSSIFVFHNPSTLLQFLYYGKAGSDSLGSFATSLEEFGSLWENPRSLLGDFWDQLIFFLTVLSSSYSKL